MKKLWYLLTVFIMAFGLCLAACDTSAPTPTPHECESECPTCGLCTDATCEEDACEEKCQGHTPAPHECESECPTCGLCTDATCEEDACEEKCQGHTPAHECESECPTCGLCTDATCQEDACEEKCQGHTPAHECESECPTCGLCTDATCEEDACEEKCECPVVLYSQDFAATPTDGMQEYVSVDGGVATLTANNVQFSVPASGWFAENKYEITFDLGFAGGANQQLFVHLPGLNPDLGANVYIAIQADGYMCLNCWYQGNLRLVYNFNEFFGGTHSAPLSWGTEMHAFRILVVDDAIELWIDGAKYLATNLSAFGGLTNGNNNNASVAIPAGTLSGLIFHPTAANLFTMDNLVIKEVREIEGPVVMEDDTTAPALVMANANNSILNFTSDDWKVEATYDVLGATANNTNIALILGGANSETGCVDAAGSTSINAQLNMLGNGKAQAVLFHYDAAAGWSTIVGRTISLPTEGTLTMKVVSCGDKIFYYINNEIMVSASYTEKGMTKGSLTTLGLFEIAGVMEYATYTYQALNAQELSEYGAMTVHNCANICPVCGLCMDATCEEAVCANKCQGHHECESECPTCGLCMDATCQEAVCANKCQGHATEPTHECESECPECGLCTDQDCQESVCANKCECPVVLYSQDFAATPTDGMENYVSVDGGVATLTGNSQFSVPASGWFAENKYEITFDLAFTGTNEQLFVHLPGLNPNLNENVYIAIQGDGYMCLNCWYQGNLRLVYNFNEFFGGTHSAPLSWGTEMHAFRIVVIDEAIELWIDGAKYLATNLSAFGGLTNGNDNNASVAIPAGTLSGLNFHPTAANVFKMDNLVIKEVKAGTESVVMEDDTTAPALVMANVNNSAINYTSDNWKVEATYDVLGTTAANTNFCVFLGGANGVTGCINAAGATTFNVQLDMNGDGTATPRLFHYTTANGWQAIQGSNITLPTEGALTMKFVSCGDNIFWYIGDQLVLQTTYSAHGLNKNNLTTLGLNEIAGVMEYSTLTYASLTEQEIAEFTALAE